MELIIIRKKNTKLILLNSTRQVLHSKNKNPGNTYPSIATPSCMLIIAFWVKIVFCHLQKVRNN